MLRDRLGSLLSRLPSRCAVCGGWPHGPVCESCHRRFARPTPRCEGCALVVPAGVARCGTCLLQPPALDACHAALGYAYPWSGLIARFKFQEQPGWAATLAALMRRDPRIGMAVDEADLLVPMPLSPRRLAQRGFNQAAELARRLAAGKLRADLLRRVREAPPQAQLDRQARLRNVAHAFAVDPLRLRELAGRRLVLVDDVMTSGASLQAAACALRRAGAARIVGVVLARTDE
ncbi:ComF family protein [Ramlibacter rhizophilus]|uniref:ComF family protein n=1 Tax=Ramlibacter rhizophilus TaxID=1781167 RepID=A0A4Z0BQI1_9BURK|nr:ComF family protein [Ramlibacter rhizophilus]TFZ01101.1 ComF family protein [Ramlibacter rhizophilus]